MAAVERSMSEIRQSHLHRMRENPFSEADLVEKKRRRMMVNEVSVALNIQPE